jgi:hypothetical protein
MHSYLGAATVSTIDPGFVTRAWKWLEKIIEIDSRLGGGSFAVIEVMQPVRSLNFHAPSKLNTIRMLTIMYRQHLPQWIAQMILPGLGALISTSCNFSWDSVPSPVARMSWL